MSANFTVFSRYFIPFAERSIQATHTFENTRDFFPHKPAYHYHTLKNSRFIK